MSNRTTIEILALFPQWPPNGCDTAEIFAYQNSLLTSLEIKVQHVMHTPVRRIGKMKQGRGFAYPVVCA
ncbi:hypothetical protein GF406_20750 [candidate division KSB1 bacterium]|nr:hypothetical protein [candidate division KSB1 bacterium]